MKASFANMSPKSGVNFVEIIVKACTGRKGGFGAFFFARYFVAAVLAAGAQISYTPLHKFWVAVHVKRKAHKKGFNCEIPAKRAAK